MRLPWHQHAWDQIERAIARDRLPHALLLEGPPGLGKGEFARQLAARLLGDTSGTAADPSGHPDLRVIALAEERKQITVDQIRELCASLSLTSHAGEYKVAIIDPADRMNVNAANSLLKTLEEPTMDTVLILVRSRLDTLPATIASRCRRMRFATPPAGMALEWLEASAPGHAWPRLLERADGAPLAALAAVEEGRDQLEQMFASDLEAIVKGRKDPLQAAAEWNKQPLQVCLRWLNTTVCRLVRERVMATGDQGCGLQIATEDLPLERLFWYLDEIQMVISRFDGALNAQLTLEGLLVPWVCRLESIRNGGAQ